MAIARDNGKKINLIPKKQTNVDLKSETHKELDKWAEKIKRSK